MAALAGLAKFAVAAFAGYVITRAGAILLGWLAVAVAVCLVLLSAVYLVRRRRQWAVATGLSVGAALSS